MNCFRTMFIKTGVSVLMLLSVTTVMAAEPPQVPWRNLEVATQTSTFYFLAGLALFLLILILILAGVLKSLVSNKDLWLKRKGVNKAAVALMLVLLATQSSPVLAATSTADATTPFIVMNDEVFWVLVLVNVFLAGLLFALLLLIRNMLRSLRGEEIAEETVTAKQDIWSGALNAAVPIEREEEIMTDHVYDGIRELDNDLPPWWIYGFYFTIVVSVVYLGYYHVIDKGDLQLAEYAKEMEEGRAQKEAYLAKAAAKVDENSVVAFTEADKLNKGKETFMNFCQACHGNAGQGGVGPNFADEYWIHGGGIKNIFKTIKYGVPAKGMIAWETQLTPLQIQEVASYVLSMKGTHPDNPKEPQGKLWTDSIPAAKADSIVTDTLNIVPLK